MFNRIKDSIDRGIVSVSVKSSTYLGVEKLKTKVENVTIELGNAAAEMGAAVYEQWKAGAVSMEYVENVCGHMKKLEEEIEEYQRQIQELEKEKQKILGGEGQGNVKQTEEQNNVCVCGLRNEAGARFCIQCGKPLS